MTDTLADNPTPILQARALSKSFGALRVANDIALSLLPGARHALIGPNGAGKSTFVNLVTGALAPSSGCITLAGTDVTHMSQAARVQRGLVRTFQITNLFSPLSVMQNVALAVTERCGAGHRMSYSTKMRSHIADESYALLQSLHLEADALRPVQELAYGRQRLVEIAVALALKPHVLLLDEPAAGVPSSDTGIIVDAIEQMPTAVALLIIEHDMALVFRVAKRITVLVQGAVLIEDTPERIAQNAQVRQVYLGEQSGA